MGIFKKALVATAITPAVYGGTRSTINYASKFVNIKASIKDPLIAGLTAFTVITVAACIGNGCDCCKCKKEEETDK